MAGSIFEGIEIKSKIFLILFLAISINWFLNLSFIFFGWENYIYEFFGSENIILISGMFGGVFVGAIFWGYVASRTNSSLHLILLNIPHGALLFIFTFLPIDSFTLYFFLIVLGIIPAAGIVGSLIYFTKSTKVEERGRVGGIITCLGLIFMCSLAFLSINIPVIWYMRFGAIAYMIIGVVFMLIIRLWGVKTREPEHFAEFNRKDFFNYLVPLVLLGLIGGIGIIFTLVEPTYHTIIQNISINLFGGALSNTLLELEVIFYTVLGAPVGLFIGFLGDFYGRKRMWYLGLIFGAGGAFLFGFFQTELSVMLTLMMFGIVFACISNFVIITYSDLLFSEKKMGRYLGLIVGIGVAGGLLFGAGIGLALIGIPVANFALTLMVLVLFGFGTLGQAQETLPPRKELEWYRTIKHLYVIHENGVCMHDYAFRKSETDSQLVSGGISGIMAIIQELTESKTRLKIIKQEDMNILLQYGTNITVCLLATEDLSILRKKMKIFTQEFEEFFRTVIPNWNGNIDYFSPADILIERIFELEKFKKLNE
ncbi:MAG TPA: MFS transporter [Candidatus Deferrimicrobium sp.]|nr:MFS transporter [Candidatus Deferrimicrobium sp.]